VPDHADFTGRTEAAAAVELRARVTGYLDRVLFKDGDRVRKGQVLFEIDPRPYRAELDAARAKLARARARLKLAAANLRRAQALAPGRGVSREEYDKVVLERDEAQAAARLAEVGLDLARLRLEFTRVSSPLDGRVGRRLLDAGNLVKADETLLATVVGEGPVYVYFDVDERTALRLLDGGKFKAGLPVAVGLATDKGFPRRGTVDFVDNRVNPTTGMLRMRATLANADGVLVPGLFVRVRLTQGRPAGGER
jgi:RND family efflux transporter MFP subunit